MPPIPKRGRDRLVSAAPTGRHHHSGVRLRAKRHGGGARKRRETQRREPPLLPQQPGRQIEPARDPRGAWRSGAEACPVGARGQLADGTVPDVGAGKQDTRRRVGVVEERCAARSEPPVGEREECLVHALQPPVEPLDHDRPVGIAVELRDVTAAAPLELVR